MKKYYYDLHIHSCLSPCGDDDMTPCNIAGMGVVAKLDIMALTDHNSCRNCPAFCEAARANGIIPIPGMELTTAEDIHVVCLFPDIKSALSFNDFVDERRILIKNRVDIFGRQLIMNSDDEVIGEDEYLLPNATLITIDEAPEFVKSFGGVCFPAHIDREANGIIATLGVFPEYPEFATAEIHDEEKINSFKEKYPILRDKKIFVSSDAHYLWDISGRLNYLELDCNEDEESIRHSILAHLISDI